MLETVQKCPLCQHEYFEEYLQCKDYTVSQEQFNIVTCQNCGFKFTNPRPDEASIGTYYQSEKYISHSNTRKGLVNQAYHIVRKIALRGKLKLVNELVAQSANRDKNKYILDYGCGTGFFLNICQEDQWQVAGVEPDAGAREAAKQLTGQHIYEDIFQANFEAKSFDVITLWHVLEHIHRLDETIESLKNILHNQGTLVVAVPNHASKDAQTFEKYWAAYDVPRHLYHFQPETMENLFRKHGMRLESYLPMYFDAYYVSLLSGQYKTGRMSYPQAIWQGYRSNKWAKQHKNNYSSLIYLLKKA